VCGGGKCNAWSNFPKGLNFSSSCRTAVDLPSLRPEVKCSWPGDTPPVDSPTAVQVIGTPMVADFDFDNDKTTSHPSIVFISYEGDYTKVDGVLRVLDGATCRLQATIQGDFPFTPEIAPAIGDVDGDGRPDIVVADIQRQGFTTTSGIAVFSALGDGSAKFKELGRQNSSSTAPIKGISLHDLDNDNRAEILTDTGIYQYRADLHAVAELENVSESSAFEPPIVHDIDGDGTAELITSTGITYWDSVNKHLTKKTSAGGQPVWNPNSDIPAAFVGVANLGDFSTSLSGGTDSVEMIVIGFGGDLTLTQVDGRVIQHVTGIGSSGGPPVIADFDGDKRMEFASPGYNEITVFDLDCLDDKEAKPIPGNCRGKPNAQGILWQVTGLQGASSGASVFDFDGDGRSEVGYADQCFMRIFDGLTGEVQFSVPRSSLTRWEYPVIADVDGDAHSEIVTGSNDYALDVGCPATDPLNKHESVAYKTTHGITVWADHDRKWAGSRPIWNQHGYSVTNVNDDGTIPPMRSVPSQWNKPDQDPNSFRQNVQGATGISLDLPDVTTVGIPGYKCQANQQALVKVQVCNRGLRPLGAGKSTLALVEANNPTNVLYTTATTQDLASGACQDVSASVKVPSSNSSFDIMIMGDPNSAVPECDEGNNTSLISNVYCTRIR